MTPLRLSFAHNPSLLRTFITKEGADRTDRHHRHAFTNNANICRIRERFGGVGGVQEQWQHVPLQLHTTALEYNWGTVNAVGG